MNAAKAKNKYRFYKMRYDSKRSVEYRKAIFSYKFSLYSQLEVGRRESNVTSNWSYLSEFTRIFVYLHFQCCEHFLVDEINT